MKIKVWHCYWYGPYETIVLLAETQSLLEAKVREAIADGWYPEDQGPMPDDWDEMMEKYQEASGDQSYFGDWTYTVIDAALCEPAHEKD